MRIESFPPVVGTRPRVLILGSMPGVRSLEAGQYYAHPRNRFWTVLSRLIELDPSAPYLDRLESLKKAGIALWDVLQHCEREGSLDTSIVRSTEVANDLAGLLEENPSIGAVAFNGKKAAQSYRRFVLQESPADRRGHPTSGERRTDRRLRHSGSGERIEPLPISPGTPVQLIECPSTSPANASRSIDQLVGEWSVIAAFLK
jgi:double-stranded uracil-DNA glycosylase